MSYWPEPDRVTRGFRPSKSSLQYQRPSGPLTTMVVSELDSAPMEMRPPLKFRRTSGDGANAARAEAAGVDIAAGDDVDRLRVRQEARVQRKRAEIRVEAVILGGRSSAHGQRGKTGAGNSSGNHESLHKVMGNLPPGIQSVHKLANRMLSVLAGNFVAGKKKITNA
jgi:hypothetical protein